MPAERAVTFVSPLNGAFTRVTREREDFAEPDRHQQKQKTAPKPVLVKEATDDRMAMVSGRGAKDWRMLLVYGDKGDLRSLAESNAVGTMLNAKV